VSASFSSNTSPARPNASNSLPPNASDRTGAGA
jgi:hypothetical protein